MRRAREGQDPKVSLSVCLQRIEERTKQPVTQDHVESNKNFIAHPSNYVLAKHTVYTDNKSPAQVTDEIVGLLALPGVR